MMQPTVRDLRIRTHPRICDLCGHPEPSPVFEFGRINRIRGFRSHWSIRNVVCPVCGFAFVSPAPDEGDLQAYYQNSFAIFGDDGGFDVDARMRMLERHAGTDRKRLVEIGGNAAGLFSRRLAETFREIVNVELNQAVSERVVSSTELADGSASMVISYYVMEHVVSPLAFLTEMARLISDVGVVLVEVPNLHLYPVDVSALDFCEHVNHFSPNTLAACAARCGLDEIERSHADRSTPFGFVAAFRKSARPQDALADPREVREAEACLRAGLRQIDRRRELLADEVKVLEAWVGNGIGADGRQGPPVLWGANRVCEAILSQSSKLRDSVVVVDSDPEKRDFLDGFDVQLPHEAASLLRSTGRIYFCTSEVAHRIMAFVETEMQISLDAKQVVITRL